MQAKVGNVITERAPLRIWMGIGSAIDETTDMRSMLPLTASCLSHSLAAFDRKENDTLSLRIDLCVAETLMP